MNDRFARELEQSMSNFPEPDPDRQALARREFLAEARRLRTQRPIVTSRRWWLAAAALMIMLVGIMFVYQGANDSSQQGLIQTELIGVPAQQSGDMITPGNVDQLVELQRLGTGSIAGAKWSPDGTTIMVYGSLGIGFYDANLELQRFVETNMAMLDAAYSPDGTEIATVHFDGTLYLLDASSGEVRLQIQAHDDSIDTVAFSPDGTMVATGGGPQDSTVRVWSTETGRELMVLHNHEMGVSNVKFGPDGDVLASTGLSYDRRHNPSNAPLTHVVELWDLEQDESLGQLHGHNDHIRAIDFSPGGERLVSAGEDGKALLWWTYTTVHEPMQRTQSDGDGVTSPHNSSSVYAVDFSDDGRFIATGRLNGVVELWSASGDYLNTWRLRESGLDLTFQPGDLEFSPNGTRLLVSGILGRTVQLIDVETGALLQQLDASGPYREVASSGDSLAAAGYSDVVVWNMQSGELQSRYQDSSVTWVHAIDILPGTQTLAIGMSSVESSSVILWDQGEAMDFAGRPLAETSYVRELAFTDDGERLIVRGGSTDETWVYDFSAQELLTTIESNQFGEQLAIHPDGERIALSSWSRREVWLWDGDSFQEQLYGHSEMVMTLTYSPDGRWLVSIDRGHNLIVWDADTGEELHLLQSDLTSSVTALAFSPDSRLLAVSGFEGIELWDTARWVPLTTVMGHTEWVTDVEFNEAGTLIVSSSTDGTVRVWGLE